jgi:hypothetical protein
MHYMDPCFDEFLTRERRHQKQMQAFYNLL